MEREQQLVSSPFVYLKTLEKALLLSAKGLPFYQISTDNWVGVSFLTGQQVLLISLEEVVEILRVPHLAPIPGVKSWIRGMTTSQGELFPISDFNGFLTQKVSALTQHSRVLVISYQDEYAGILVDRVLGLQRIANQNKQKITKEVIPTLAPFIIGSFVNEYLDLPIISSKLLMGHPRFRDVALKEDEFSEFEG